MTGPESSIIRVVVGLLYPFILLLGFYVIINGHYTPGGGFQGGSILASLFIARYVVFPVEDIDSEILHLAQRFVLSLLLLGPVVLLFTGGVHAHPDYRAAYLTLMDILIGVQVGFGLGVAVLRFAFFKGVGESWRF